MLDTLICLAILSVYAREGYHRKAIPGLLAAAFLGCLAGFSLQQLRLMEPPQEMIAIVAAEALFSAALGILIGALFQLWRKRFPRYRLHGR